LKNFPLKMNNQEKIFQIVKRIPKGKVVTYKQIARISGIKSPRVIGNIIHKNKYPDSIPCHRVVKSDGTLATGYAFGGIKAQKKKLIDEGIKFVKNKIDLNIYQI